MVHLMQVICAAGYAIHMGSDVKFTAGWEYARIPVSLLVETSWQLCLFLL